MLKAFFILIMATILFLPVWHIYILYSYILDHAVQKTDSQNSTEGIVQDFIIPPH